jgi:hypothetical protein
MLLAAEGAAIAHEMGRKAQLQHFEDLIADAIYAAEQGNLGHRRQAEAVLAALIANGAVR